jgi:hypothetical protein
MPSTRGPEPSRVQNNPMHQKIVQQNQRHDKVHFGHVTARRRRETDRFGTLFFGGARLDLILFLTALGMMS